MSEVISFGLRPVMQETAPLRRKILASLRHAIEIGQLAPEARLVEADLCRELNVSRTSLREALRELETEGLVSRGARGLVVTKVSEKDANDLYQVRAALEGLVAEQFAQLADTSDVQALQATVARLEQAYKSGSFNEILMAKKAFYDVICAGARNAIVADILGRLNSRINQLRSTVRFDPTRGSQSMVEIKELAAALMSRDPAAARNAAVRHVNAAKMALEQRTAARSETTKKHRRTHRSG